jgi:hypothetical protein
MQETLDAAEDGLGRGYGCSEFAAFSSGRRFSQAPAISQTRHPGLGQQQLSPKRQPAAGIPWTQGSPCEGSRDCERRRTSGLPPVASPCLTSHLLRPSPSIVLFVFACAVRSLLASQPRDTSLIDEPTRLSAAGPQKPQKPHSHTLPLPTLRPILPFALRPAGAPSSNQNPPFSLVHPCHCVGMVPLLTGNGPSSSRRARRRGLTMVG